MEKLAQLFSVLSFVIVLMIIRPHFWKLVCRIFNQNCIKHTQIISGVIVEVNDEPVLSPAFTSSVDHYLMENSGKPMVKYFLTLDTISNPVKIQVTKNCFNALKTKVGEIITIECQKYIWGSNNSYEELGLC